MAAMECILLTQLPDVFLTIERLVQKVAALHAAEIL
jgi:hypothetical protein